MDTWDLLEFELQYLRRYKIDNGIELLQRFISKNPEHPVARALARPGHELQHRLATAEPTPDQLEVADAALRACLELENGTAHTN